MPAEALSEQIEEGRLVLYPILRFLCLKTVPIQNKSHLTTTDATCVCQLARDSNPVSQKKGYTGKEILEALPGVNILNFTRYNIIMLV